MLSVEVQEPKVLTNLLVVKYRCIVSNRSLNEQSTLPQTTTLSLSVHVVEPKFEEKYIHWSCVGLWPSVVGRLIRSREGRREEETVG